MSKFKVQDKYRTHLWSHTPGGSEVTVYKRDGKILVYDKIKKPRKYIARLAFKDDIIRVDLNGKKMWGEEDPGKKYWEQED